jgi:hypothetical protein
LADEFSARVGTIKSTVNVATALVVEPPDALATTA